MRRVHRVTFAAALGLVLGTAGTVIVSTPAAADECDQLLHCATDDLHDTVKQVNHSDLDGAVDDVDKTVRDTVNGTGGAVRHVTKRTGLVTDQDPEQAAQPTPDRSAHHDQTGSDTRDTGTHANPARSSGSTSGNIRFGPRGEHRHARPQRRLAPVGSGISRLALQQWQEHSIPRGLGTLPNSTTTMGQGLGPAPYPQLAAAPRSDVSRAPQIAPSGGTPRSPRSLGADTRAAATPLGRQYPPRGLVLLAAILVAGIGAAYLTLRRRLGPSR